MSLKSQWISITPRPASKDFTLAICGPGECGKDTVADWFDQHTRLCRGPSTSELIFPRMISKFDCSPEQVWRERGQYRDAWAAEGDRMREHDQAALVRETLERGDICVGVRRREEMQAALDANLFTIALWIDRPGVPPDTSLTYGPELCDSIVPNWWGLGELYSRLARLARSWGI